MNTKTINRFKTIYDKAGQAGNLPWNHKTPTHFLSEITQSRGKPGRALDIGCGSGVDSVFLAKEGWDVTAIDFVPQAVDMTKARADKAGVTLALEQADILTWNTDQKFDLVLDAGVLHNMKRSTIQPYREKILGWLAPEGIFVLVHWERQGFFDVRPIGPRREARETIQNLFAPELHEQDFHRMVRTGLPIIIGPSMAQATYWFKRV